MSTKGKKFISPGAWFSLIYPFSWNEFEDAEGSFLFYNPNKWTGNFRISAFRDDKNQNYGLESVRYELQQNDAAKRIQCGDVATAYSCETFQEEGAYYVMHVWIAGIGNVAFECTFTVPKGEKKDEAEAIIASLSTYAKDNLPTLEIIPIRVLEINLVNEAFEWSSNAIKKQLKRDFTSVDEDVAKIQQIVESGSYKSQQREVWESFGLAFGTIIENQIDGMEWHTAIKGKEEMPVLRYKESDLILYPTTLIWELMRAEKRFNLTTIFEEIKKEVETQMN